MRATEFVVILFRRTGGMLLSPDRGMQQIGCEMDRFRFSGHAHRREFTVLAAEFQLIRSSWCMGVTEGRRWPKKNLREIVLKPVS